jgi:quercetin dioxygenase-like cupin family protein
MPSIKWSDAKEERIDPEFSNARGPVVRGQEIEVGRVVYPAGAEIKAHALPNEQIQTVMRGKALLRIAGEERIVGPGEALLIRPQTEFSARILEEFEVLRFRDVGPAQSAGKEGGRGPSFFKWAEMTSDFITPMYSSGKGPTITGERIEVAFMEYPAGTEAKPHSHPNEQIQVPLKGKIRGLAGADVVSGPGEVVLIPALIQHWVSILEDYETINCKNIVPGWSVYNARWEK